LVSGLSLACTVACAAAHADEGATPITNGAEIQASVESREPEVDTDGDGRVDMWRTYAMGGTLQSIAYDNNADGKPDEWVRYGDGVETRELARWNNGLINEKERKHFKSGILVKRVKELLTKGKWQTLETWQLQPGGKVAKVTRLGVKGRTTASYEPLEVR
jgi:hypothetical protein